MFTIHVEIMAKNKSFFWNVLLNIRFPSARTFDAILDDLGRNCLDKTDRDVSCRTGFHINGPKNGGHILQVLQWVAFSLSLLSCALIFICMENILWFREFTEPITFYLSDQQ